MTTDARTIQERLREYAKDWRIRADSCGVCYEAANRIDALERALNDCVKVYGGRNRIGRYESPTIVRARSALHLSTDREEEGGAT